MIFVTVGTHEQGLDRLLVELDRLVEIGEIKHEVFAQIGYSNYIPKNYEYKKLLGFNEMESYVKKSDIVITHGGPGSIFQSLQHNKIPIVVPRSPEYKEHVDNHQILFTKRLESSDKILAVYDINELGFKINKYDKLILGCKIDDSGKDNFIRNFKKLIVQL
jgi:UDP-N-acetylglucosamine transferase subunit ALG13